MQNVNGIIITLASMPVGAAGQNSNECVINEYRRGRSFIKRSIVVSLSQGGFLFSKRTTVYIKRNFNFTGYHSSIFRRMTVVFFSSS